MTVIYIGPVPTATQSFCLLYPFCCPLMVHHDTVFCFIPSESDLLCEPVLCDNNNKKPFFLYHGLPITKATPML